MTEHFAPAEYERLGRAHAALKLAKANEATTTRVLLAHIDTFEEIVDLVLEFVRDRNNLAISGKRAAEKAKQTVLRMPEADRMRDLIDDLYAERRSIEELQEQVDKF